MRCVYAVCVWVGTVCVVCCVSCVVCVVLRTNTGGVHSPSTLSFFLRLHHDHRALRSSRAGTLIGCLDVGVLGIIRVYVCM